MTARRSRHAALLAIALTACSCREESVEPQPSTCSEGSAQSALESVDRKIIGAAHAYPADGELRGRDQALAGSQRERREVAWQTVAKVLADVPLSASLPNAPTSPAYVPSFQTWYDFDDLRRVFHRVYGALEKDEKAARTPFSEGELDAGFAWNVNALDELPGWSEESYQAYLAAIDKAGEVAGLGGISRVGYSPGAGRHLLRSYPEILACEADGAPPAHVRGPADDVRVAREPVALAGCHATTVGSYAIGEDEVLRAVLDDGDGAVVTLRASDRACTAAAGSSCELSGPATVDVIVDAGEDAVDSFVTVTRESTRPEWSACLDGAFPLDAAVVKADYRRADFGMALPVYATSGAALTQRMTDQVSWDLADGEADPGPDDIYTLTLPSGSAYRLAALHIMTKELDHWLWITLWWSPEPDTDFGADRPAAIAALSGPWQSYKMCVVTAFDERDPDPGGGFSQEHPSLADALAAVHRGVGNPSWCSNPYLELGHGNAGSNCVGCHQHGGTELLSEDILFLPANGRTRLRNNFPTDYSWAVNSGDHLAQLFAEEEAYYLAAP